MIGSRPDIGFAVVKLAQQMANPSNNHYRVGLHLCRYLLATCRYWLVYNRLSNKLLVAYSDSDWGQDHEHHKSTTGYFTMLAQGITSWLSRKQKSVGLSSTEAEYMALSVRATRAEHSRRFLSLNYVIKYVTTHLQEIPQRIR